MEDILEVSSFKNLKIYLVLPSKVGRTKCEAFKKLKDRIKQKIDGWSFKFLSQVAKEVYIKSV